MTTGYRLSMYKNIIWNTGAAAMRFRHNLKLKKKKAAGRKRQAASFKRLKKDTIKWYKITVAYWCFTGSS